MFYSITLSSLAVLTAALIAILDFHIYPEASNEVSYQSLVNSTNAFRSKKALEKEPAHQTRQSVQKDVWTENSGRQTHIRLKSQGSNLLIKQKNKKIEIREDLDSIECSMQEKVDFENNCQEVRWIIARKGSYLYPEHCFQAKDAELSLYSILGTALPDTQPDIPCFIKIEAATVDFTVGNLLQLSGNVRLFTNRPQEKESFALAEELIYDPENSTFFLKGKPGKRVLFWQDDIRMAATELQIRKNPSTKTDHVQGFGDVHFAFDWEEEEAFHAIFGRWL